ncbi:Hypothetical protein GbCGDNIH4_1600 [Granulibacter bethesdensis CGDNIH4]|nr:Hypothetical protein GbCGDNIH4_1600 [Granulibacter bethesdensis CGDNIH4]
MIHDGANTHDRTFRSEYPSFFFPTGRACVVLSSHPYRKRTSLIMGSISHSDTRQFIVGHDIQGQWVVCDQSGAVGGIFKNRDSALSFARSETGHHPHAVFCAPDHLVMDFFSTISHTALRPQS